MKNYCNYLYIYVLGHEAAPARLIVVRSDACLLCCECFNIIIIIIIIKTQLVLLALHTFLPA